MWVGDDDSAADRATELALLWRIARRKMASLFSERVHLQTSSAGYDNDDSIVGQVLFDLNMLRLVMQHITSNESLLDTSHHIPTTDVEAMIRVDGIAQTQRAGMCILQTIVSMGTTCRAWQHMLMHRKAPLGVFVLEAIAQVSVIGTGALPHRRCQPHQVGERLLTPHAHSCVYLAQFVAEAHTHKQLRRLRDANLARVLHCATPFSVHQRVAFNDDMQDCRQLTVSVPTSACQMAFVSNTALLISATNVVGKSMLAVVRQCVGDAHPPTSRACKNRPFELVLYTHAHMSYTPQGEPTCTGLGHVRLDSMLSSDRSTRRDGDEQSNVTLMTPHEVCLSECGRHVAIACTGAPPYNLSILMTVAITPGAISPMLLMGEPTMLRPHDEMHCHAQSMWFISGENGVTHLMVVFGSGLSAPANEDFFVEQHHALTPTYVLGRYEYVDAYCRWAQLEFYGPFDGRVHRVSTSTTGTTAALLITTSDVPWMGGEHSGDVLARKRVHIWSDRHDRPYEISEAVGDVGGGITILATTLSPGAETLLILKRRPRGHFLEMWRHSPATSTYIFVLDCVHSYVFCDGDGSRSKCTHDLTCSPCGRFAILCSGGHRFGSTLTYISTIDLATLYMNRGPVRPLGVRHKYRQPHPKGIDILHKGDGSDRSDERSTCIRNICWAFDCMWLGLGKGAVCMDHATPFETLASLLRASGA